MPSTPTSAGESAPPVLPGPPTAIWCSWWSGSSPTRWASAPPPSTPFLVRFRADGERDGSFAANGLQRARGVTAVVADGDDLYALGGDGEPVATRFVEQGGSPDTVFGVAGQQRIEDADGGRFLVGTMQGDRLLVGGSGSAAFPAPGILARFYRVGLAR